MPRKLPPLNALRAFEAAGRHESFTDAAQELGVSHSAISRHVRGLELRLEVKLFRVQSRGVALTNEGARYLAGITPIFDAIAQTTEDITGVATGFVSVSCEPVFAVKWLVPHLTGFYERYPEIELRVDATRHLIDIAHYEAEVAIRFFFDKPVDETFDLISDAPVYPFIAPSLAANPMTDPRQLLQYKILRDRRGDAVTEWFALVGIEAEAVPPNAWRMRATLAITAAVAGQGVLFASADIVAEDVKAGRLVPCFDIPLHRGSYRLLLGDGAIRRRPVRMFKEWLLAESAELRGEVFV